MLVRNLGTMKVIYWVNVSDSSGTGSPEKVLVVDHLREFWYWIT